MRVKTSELTEQGLIHVLSLPDLSWQTCGPIIERERISIRQWTNVPIVHAYMPQDNAPWGAGPTPLIAAMRCFCCSRLGDEVDVPEELM